MKRFWWGISALCLVLGLSLLVWGVLAGALDEPSPVESVLGASAKQFECAGPSLALCSRVRYEIILANAGPDLSYVAVFDELPFGIEFIPGSGSRGVRYDPTSRMVQWEGSLRANSALSLTFGVASTVSSPTTLTNTARICINPLAWQCIERSITTPLDPPLWPTPTPTPTEVPAPSLDCSSAITLTCDVHTYTGTTKEWPANISQYSCAPWLETGPEAVYVFETNAPLASFAVELQQMEQDLDIFVLRDCDPLSCIAAGDRIVTVPTPSGRYVVVIDGRHGARGEYALGFTCVPAIPTSTPAGPTGTPSVTPATATTTPTSTRTVPPPTRTPTATPTPSPSATATRTPFMTPTLPFTPTPSPTCTPVASPTVTRKLVARQRLPVIMVQHPRPPTPAPTPTVSGPVSLDSVWIEGPKGVPNHVFRRCEVLYEWVQITNVSREPVLITIDWVIYDWMGREVPAWSYWGWQVWWPSGSYRAHLPLILPANAPLAPYSLMIRLRSRGNPVQERMAYFTINDDEPSSPPLADLVTCRGISPYGEPLDITDTFSVKDRAAFAWGWWQRAGGVPHRITWSWYQPDGRLYASYQDEFIEACTFYAWAWLEIAGTEVAGLPGTWKLEVRMDDVFVATRWFRIVDESTATDHVGVASAGGGHMAAGCEGPCQPKREP